MIPKIYFNASYYLQAEIFGSYFDYNQISEIIIKFKKFFQKKEEKVMIKIEEMTGFLWNQRIISVWFFDSWHTSISYPLLLNIYHGDIDFIFFNLIHELVHNNLLDLNVYKKKNEYDLIELEALVNLVTKKIVSYFFNKTKLNELCKNAEFGGVYKYVWIRVKELENNINFRKTNLKEWMSSNKSKYVICE